MLRRDEDVWDTVQQFWCGCEDGELVFKNISRLQPKHRQIKARSRDVTDPVTLKVNDVTPQSRVDLIEAILQRLETIPEFKTIA